MPDTAQGENINPLTTSKGGILTQQFKQWIIGGKHTHKKSHSISIYSSQHLPHGKQPSPGELIHWSGWKREITLRYIIRPIAGEVSRQNMKHEEFLVVLICDLSTDKTYFSETVAFGTDHMIFLLKARRDQARWWNAASLFWKDVIRGQSKHKTQT